LARAFDPIKTSNAYQGWLRLDNAMSIQERLAEIVHGLAELNTLQKELLAKMDIHNQKIQTVLGQTQRKILFQLMSSKEEFPKNVKASKALSTVESGLSRSCSLSLTWQTRGG
jgi:hypothetical protein